MSKHTKGPWKNDRLGVITGGTHFLTSVAETYACKWAHCQATSADRHSQSAADYCGQMYDEAQANARLIAAAPELLEALQAMVKHADECNAYWEENDCPLDTKEHGLAVFMNCRAGDKARAAIAKATGAQS